MSPRSELTIFSGKFNGLSELNQIFAKLALQNSFLLPLSLFLNPGSGKVQLFLSQNPYQ